jgi:hypothetical protein
MDVSAGCAGSGGEFLVRDMKDEEGKKKKKSGINSVARYRRPWGMRALARVFLDVENCNL